MTKPISLSLIIPAYNEENFILETLTTLDNAVKNKSLSYEIVVVNDGSNDKTLTKALSYAEKNKHVKIISYVKNQGKGFAVKNGFLQATGEIIVFTDSDLEIDLRTISRYLKALEYGDIVIASKWHPDSNVQSPILRKFMSHAFNSIVRLLINAPLKDTQSGLKAMRKSVFIDIFPKLAVKRYAFDVELLAVANLYGLRIVEMPVTIQMDASFKLQNILRMFLDVLGIAYRLRVLHWYQTSVNHKNNLQRFASTILRE